MPMVWVSTMARNSLFTGSVASFEISLRLSSSGRPALMPRTMTSTASGNSLRNLSSRRFLRNDSIQNGRPQPAAKPKPSAAIRPVPNSIMTTKAPTPTMAKVDRKTSLAPAEPGLLQPHRKRRPLRLLVALLDFLERTLDLLAARSWSTPRRVAAAPPDRCARRWPRAVRLSFRRTGTGRGRPRPRRRRRRPPGSQERRYSSQHSRA